MCSCLTGHPKHAQQKGGFTTGCKSSEGRMFASNTRNSSKLAYTHGDLPEGQPLEHQLGLQALTCTAVTRAHLSSLQQSSILATQANSMAAALLYEGYQALIHSASQHHFNNLHCCSCKKWDKSWVVADWATLGNHPQMVDGHNQACLRQLHPGSPHRLDPGVQHRLRYSPGGSQKRSRQEAMPLDMHLGRGSKAARCRSAFFITHFAVNSHQSKNPACCHWPEAHACMLPAH